MMKHVRILVCTAAVACALAPLKAAAKSNPAKPASKAAKPAKKAAGADAAKVNAARAQETFEPFCEQWMGKLAARERDNLGHLDWKATGSGYNANYVGYSKEHGCTVSSEGKVPIGRVLYKEVTYHQEGSTLEEAKSSTPQPIEIYEVTELFQFSKGKWSTD